MAIKNSFIRNWNRQKKLRFAKFQKKRALKISDNKSDGVTNPNVFIQVVFNRYRGRQERVTSVKHGGDSVMVSSCISVTGVGNLVRIDEIMNAETCMHTCIHAVIYYGLRSAIGDFMVSWRVKVCWSANNNIAKNFQTTVPMSQIQLCSSTVLIHSLHIYSHQHYTEPQCFVEVRKLLKVLSSRRSLGMWENQRKHYFRNPILEISFGL